MLLLLDCEVEQLSVVLARLDGFTMEVGGKPLAVSFAVGWKACEPGERFEELVEEADRNLYSHKAAAKAQNEPLTAPV